MKDRDFVRLTFFVALATLLLCSVAIPAFGQDAAAPTQPAQNAGPAAPHAAPPTSVHHAASSTPPRYSPQSSVAPRTTVDTLAEIKKRGKLRVGVSMIVPWAMHDKDGNLIGFEIDVAKKIARDLGVEVEFYPDEFRYLIPDLLDNRFDVIISNLSISTNRAMQVNFSAPYNSTDLSLIANRKLAGGFQTMADFDKPGVTIGVLDMSLAVDVTSNAFPNAQLKTYVEDGDLFQALLDGKISAAVADSPEPEIISKLYSDQVDLPATKVLATFPAAFATRRGDMDFINFLNSWIEARTVNQWLERRRNYWFKTTDWEKRL
ncbi:MAG TPA: transporter substrate-binding domain-containing protein [Candidatus Acidoferrales bacterium]